MSKNFYCITLVDENETIKITPDILYIIDDQTPEYMVVMYKLEHYNNTDLINPKMISTIPYYISDGRTNNLRANMLYPFGCFSIFGSKNCPFDMSKPRSNGTLLKYSLLQNVNNETLELELIKYFFDRQYSGTDLFDKSIFRVRSNRDLNSVLPRLANLLDFTICIINDIFINFNYIEEDQYINQGKYSPFNKEQLEMKLDYTDMAIFGLGSEFCKKDDSNFNNNFRSVLLTIFHNYCNLFITTNVIQINKISLQPNFINTDNFNIIAQVCNKEYASNNIFNYIQISNEFKKIFLNKIDFLEIDVEQKDMFKSIILIIDLSDLLSSSIPLTPERAYLKFRSKFGVRCSEFKEGYVPDTYDVDVMSIDQLLHEIDLLDIKFKKYKRFEKWNNYTLNKLNSIQKDEMNVDEYKDELITIIEDLRTIINGENVV